MPRFISIHKQCEAQGTSDKTPDTGMVRYHVRVRKNPYIVSLHTSKEVPQNTELEGYV